MVFVNCYYFIDFVVSTVLRYNKKNCSDIHLIWTWKCCLLFNSYLKNNFSAKSNIERDEWIHDNTKKHNLRGSGFSVKNPRKSLDEKKTLLPAIEMPHPGMSYNPSYQDHKNLLTIVAEKEVKLIREEDHLTRVTSKMFQKVSTAHRDVRHFLIYI